MEEKTEDHPEISLKLSKKTVSSMVYTLKIPNFFTMPRSEKPVIVCSPPFQFDNTIWRFRISADNPPQTAYRYFTTYLVRLSSEIRKQQIFSSFVLLDANDEVYYKEDKECHFVDDVGTIGILSHPVSPYDARNSILTMIIHLISIEIGVESDQEPPVSHKGISLRQDFKGVLLIGQDHNITFNVRGKEIKAHRDILRARSNVFQSIFSDDTLNKEMKVIDVPDCDPEAFEQFLYYIYTGETSELNEKNMFGLYYVAHMYNFAQLKEECRLFIKKSLSVTNIRDAVELAATHNDEGLMDFAMSYFTSNADVIWPSKDWQLFMKENYVVANEFITKSFKKSHDQSAKRLKTC